MAGAPRTAATAARLPLLPRRASRLRAPLTAVNVHRPRVRLRATRAPPPLPLRRQPEDWQLQLAALTLLPVNVHRPRVHLRAAGAPPRLPLPRQPEVWRLQLAALARLLVDVYRPRVPHRAARAPSRPPLRRQTEAWRLQRAVLAFLVASIHRPQRHSKIAGFEVPVLKIKPLDCTDPMQEAYYCVLVQMKNLDIQRERRSKPRHTLLD
jgi:hypothetical protein